MIVLNQIKKIFNTNSGCVTAVDSVNLSIRKGKYSELSVTVGLEKVH